MRKLFAIFLTFCLVIPLLLASQALISSSMWVLDRQFYIDTLGSEQVTNSLLSDDMLSDLIRRHLPLPPETDVQPLALFLRSVISQEYLQIQIEGLINGWFDYLQGDLNQLHIFIDLQPIKTMLAAEKQTEFLQALVSILPICEAGQMPNIGGEVTIACKPQGISDDILIENVLQPAMPQILEQLPDEIPLGEEWGNSQEKENWRTWLPGMAIPASIMLGILVLSFAASGFWLIAAFIYDKSWRQRLQWLGVSAAIPSVIIFLIGLIARGQSAINWLRYGFERVHSQLLPSIFSSPAVLEALASSALPRISQAFLIVGGIEGGMALALLLWGILTPKNQ